VIAAILASESIDPGPILAWFGLGTSAVVAFAAVVAFLWWWVAMPQIRAAVDGRVSQAEQATSAGLRRVHERIDEHLNEQH
jgi:hypothetical protein